MATLKFEHTIPRSARAEDGNDERVKRGRGSCNTDTRQTGDRKRDRSSSTTKTKTTKPLRRSVFREEGMDDLDSSVYRIREGESAPDIGPEHTPREMKVYRAVAQWKLGKAKTSSPGLKPANSSAPPNAFAPLPRAALIFLLIAMVVPGFRYGSDGDGKMVNMTGADAGLIRSAEMVENGSLIEGRAASPTDICTRWAHQVANVNGTLYIYGGEAKTTSGQTTDTWNNNLLTLDLTKTWDRASPSLTGLTQPSGPPAVALGALWNSYTSLFLYGGEFADNPSTSPLPVSMWEYSIGSASWTEWATPVTSAGNNSDADDQPVQRSAEGAGISVPELGRSWYFGGHLDMYTTAGWSNQIARVYLKSLLEFTHPGYANSGVSSLEMTAAGNGGVYRNITEGGIQDDAGFTERADGVLIYIPGWSESGILLGLAGGTNESFTEMNTIDVYDIANSTWYKQATSGSYPPIRVNPCAVVAAAPDLTSFNVYLYGGQNLIPYDEQTQYSDMWILTIPSFTWTQVSMEGQSEPPARAGHTCTMWDGQMVVVGGYVGTDISCDSPGMYVFNASSLQWTNSFTSLSGSSNYDDQGSSVLQGSVGYEVPAQVQSIIGGSSQGGATASTPAAGSATVGPFATGRSPVVTITQSGTTITQTANPTSTTRPSSSSPSSTAEKKSKNVGAIAAGAIAGVLACIAAYLAFCTWLYRRRIAKYQNHMKMAQRSSYNAEPPLGGDWSSSEDRQDMSSANTGEVILGPFGTAIGRRSNGSDQSSGGKFGGDRDTGYVGGGRGHVRQTSGATASLVGSVGSQEDLLGGQEPSFFSVVLNPRRTLRVVNTD